MNLKALADFSYTWIIEQSIYVALIFIFVQILSILLRKKSPLLHLALWSLILFRLVLPPDVSHPLSLRNLSQGLFHIEKEAELANTFSVEGNSQALTPVMNVVEIYSIHWQEIILFIWILGVLIFLYLFLARRRRWSNIESTATPIKNSSLLSLVSEWRARFGIKRNVVLKLSSEEHMPFTTGLWRPVIILPKQHISQSVETNFEHLEAIIAHEMAHIKRLDDLWIFAQNIIQAFYFFHPAVWLTNRNIYIARECICDSMVLAHGTLSKRVYGQGLITSLKTSSWGLEGAGVLAAFSSPQKIIKTRITNIKKGHIMKIPFVLKIGFVLLAIVILPMASQSKDSADTALVSALENQSISFMCPLQTGVYKLSSSYGEQKHPISGEMRFHRAVDLAAKTGTPVYAAAAGTITKVVTDIEPGNGSGRYIEVQHNNGFFTRYTQLHKVSVQEGQTVQKGKEMGQVGSSGLSTGPHLHFEMWKDGQHVNPADYINF